MINKLMRISFIIFFSLLAACNLKPQALLKIGTNVWPGYELLYLARDLGYYTENTVKLVELPSATEVSHAFQHQLLDVAALTLDEALTLAQYEEDIRIILVTNISSGGDVLLAKPGIDSLAQLQGKKIGVENTAVGAILLNGALEAANLKATDINVIGLNVDQHFHAYQANHVDAIVTFEPVKSQLLKRGAKLLFDSSQIPNRIVDVLVTRQQVIEKRPQQLRQILNAYFKAQTYFQQFPDPAANYLAQRLSVQPAEVASQFSGLILPNLDENKRLLSGTNPVLQQSLAMLVTLMLQQKLLSSAVNPAQMLDGSLLPHTSVK